jgi:hypothetical protein
MPSLQDDPFRQNNETGRHSTYLLPIAVQTNRATSTVKIRVFPGEASLLRLASAVLVEIDEKWASENKAYIKWECQND